MSCPAPTGEVKFRKPELAGGAPMVMQQLTERHAATPPGSRGVGVHFLKGLIPARVQAYGLVPSGVPGSGQAGSGQTGTGRAGSGKPQKLHQSRRVCNPTALSTAQGHPFLARMFLKVSCFVSDPDSPTQPTRTWFLRHQCPRGRPPTSASLRPPASRIDRQRL